MSKSPRFLLACGVAAAIAAPGVPAETCQPDATWQHEHTKAKANTITTDVKGSRATRIEVCRSDAAAPADLKVEVQFEGSREARPLALARCVDKFAKWAVIRTHGAKTDTGPSAAGGLYRVCKE